MALSISSLSNSASYVMSTLMGNKARFQDVATMDSTETFIFLFVFVMLFIFIMWVGAYIFNHTLTKVMPSIRKVSVGDFIGLYIVLHILFC